MAPPNPIDELRGIEGNGPTRLAAEIDAMRQLLARADLVLVVVQGKKIGLDPAMLAKMLEGAHGAA